MQASLIIVSFLSHITSVFLCCFFVLLRFFDKQRVVSNAVRRVAHASYKPLLTSENWFQMGFAAYARKICLAAAIEHPDIPPPVLQDEKKTLDLGEIRV